MQKEACCHLFQGKHILFGVLSNPISQLIMIIVSNRTLIYQSLLQSWYAAVCRFWGSSPPPPPALPRRWLRGPATHSLGSGAERLRGLRAGAEAGPRGRAAQRAAGSPGAPGPALAEIGSGKAAGKGIWSLLSLGLFGWTFGLQLQPRSNDLGPLQ